LARCFGTTPQFWINLPAAYDLDVATRASADRIKRDVHPPEAASRCWSRASPSIDQSAVVWRCRDPSRRRDTR
jgi:hypothetical protein